MCYGCYEEAGKPKILNEEVKKAADLIGKLYEHPDCGAGGYAHVVTDDWNLEDGSIDFCIKEAEKGEYDIDEEGRQLCLSILNQLKSLSKDERYSSLALADGFINPD